MHFAEATQLINQLESAGKVELNSVYDTFKARAGWQVLRIADEEVNLLREGYDLQPAGASLHGIGLDWGRLAHGMWVPERFLKQARSSEPKKRPGLFACDETNEFPLSHRPQEVVTLTNRVVFLGEDYSLVSDGAVKGREKIEKLLTDFRWRHDARRYCSLLLDYSSNENARRGIDPRVLPALEAIAARCASEMLPNEYYQRTIRVNQMIMESPEILDNIRFIFNYKFGGGTHSKADEQRYENLLDDYGTKREVLRIGQIVLPNTQKVVHLELKIRYRDPDEWEYLDPEPNLNKGDGFEIAAEAGYFEDAYLVAEKVGVPFVYSVMTLGNRFGVITEDLTWNGQCSFEDINHEKALITRPGENGVEIWFDPVPAEKHSKEGNKYLEKPARLDL